MPTQFLNPPGLAPTNGWTHVVTSTGCKTIHVSGQVRVDERGQLVGKGDLFMLKVSGESGEFDPQDQFEHGGDEIERLARMGSEIVRIVAERDAVREPVT